MQKRFTPSILKIAERFKLVKRVQADNEEIKKYAVALCKLATNCQYGGAFLDDALTQCFVQYPLPKVEDIFASFAGGMRFSKWI